MARTHPLPILPSMAPDVLLSRAELARVLGVQPRDVPALVRKPFAADPAQHRFLVAGYQDKLPASAWITSELVDSDAVAETLRQRGFSMAERSYCPADLMMFDLVSQVARLRAQDTA